MKSKVSLIVVICIVAITSSIVFLKWNRKPPDIRHGSIVQNYNKNGLLAHAFGSVDGQWYTNSKEAFVASYDLGYRLFEADMVILRDGTAIVAHDKHENFYELDKHFRYAVWEQVQGAIYNLGRPDNLKLKEPVMRVQEFCRFLAKYPDVKVVADTKYLRHVRDHLNILRRMEESCSPEILDMIVPHVRDQEELESMKKIYNWKDYMLALYRTQWKGEMGDSEVVEFVKKNNIGAVMMWHRDFDPTKTLQANHKKRQRFNVPLMEKLQSQGVGVYVHDLLKKEDKEKFKKLFVGVYDKVSYPRIKYPEN